MVREAELQALKSQINPHFIFNSLSSIQHFITANEKPSALKYLTKFSHLLRQVLESSITGNVVMKEELQLLKMYLELEALRFDNSFLYTIEVDDALDTEMIEIPTMIGSCSRLESSYVLDSNSLKKGRARPANANAKKNERIFSKSASPRN